jgi:hypothetical protein
MFRPVAPRFLVAGSGDRVINDAISHELVARWRNEGRITDEEALQARAMRYCDQHTRGVLEALFPGAKRRLLGDRWKKWKRSTAKAWLCWRRCAAPARFPNANLIGRHQTRGALRALGEAASVVRTGERMGRRSAGCMVQWQRPWNAWGRSDPRLVEVRKLKRAKELARRRRWAERQERRNAGLLPPSIGFKPRPEPPDTLEQEFRSGRGDRPKPSKPPYEA